MASKLTSREAELQQVVQRIGGAGRPGAAQRCQRVHGDQALRFCHLGADEGRAGSRMFKETGHVNAYFPLFIPKSYLSKEAEPRGRVRQGVCGGDALPVDE